MLKCAKLLKNVSQTFLVNNSALRNVCLDCANQNKWLPAANSKIHHDTTGSNENWSETSKKPISNPLKSIHQYPEDDQFKNDKEHIIRLKNDPDVFGSYEEPEIFYESDLREERHFTEQVSRSKKLSTKQYADIIKELIKKRKIKEAIDVLEVKMLKDDKVKPENYIYNLLLGACGRVGYTKKAFKLYNDMKKRGLQVTGGTYTALFNACANSPWPSTDGLTRARHLYDIMIEKGYEPNDTNYNSMIKAFGRCGDLPLAFSLVDEMAKNNIAVRDDTINFLLQACISDREAGFRHSLLVWRKVVKKNIAPTVYTFNLMLRCIRDCGLGDLEVTKDVVEKLVNKNNAASVNKLQSDTSERILVGDSTRVEDIDDISRDVVKVSKDTIPETTSSQLTRSTSLANNNTPFDVLSRPNLLSKTPHLGNILSLAEVTKPEDRLLLVGGALGFLETMREYKCTPDIKTFSQLLDVIPSTNAAEKEILAAMKKLYVKPDLDFYNMLIKKRSMRFDYERAKEVLVSMKQQKYRPNLVTYGVLALGCKNREEALELIETMTNAKYRLNSEILGAMLHQACYHLNFGYIFEIMELCISENVAVNKKFLEHLDELKQICKEKLRNKELTKHKEKSFGIFKARYKQWLDQVQKDESEDAHPWQQFRQNHAQEEGVNYIGKDSARFKPRHTSRFKVKTSNKRRC